MARSITLTDIPEAVYERLQERAEARGLTLSKLVRQELIERTPKEKQLGMQEWLDLVACDEPVNLPRGAVVEALHAGRAERY